MTINQKLPRLAAKLDIAHECARRLEALQHEDDDVLEREEKERCCAAAYDEMAKLEWKLAKIPATNVEEIRPSRHNTPASSLIMTKATGQAPATSQSPPQSSTICARSARKGLSNVSMSELILALEIGVHGFCFVAAAAIALLMLEGSRSRCLKFFVAVTIVALAGTIGSLAGRGVRAALDLDHVSGGRNARRFELGRKLG